MFFASYPINEAIVDGFDFPEEFTIKMRVPVVSYEKLVSDGMTSSAADKQVSRTDLKINAHNKDMCEFWAAVIKIVNKIVSIDI